MKGTYRRRSALQEPLHPEGLQDRGLDRQGYPAQDAQTAEDHPRKGPAQGRQGGIHPVDRGKGVKHFTGTMTGNLGLGEVELPGPVILAPLAGLTDYPFRSMVRRFGPCLAVSEMIASQALVRDNRKTLRMISTAGREYPLAAQISGSDPAVMALAAKMVRDMGAAVVDINMGCPQPKVVKTNSGAALMRDVRLAGKVIESVVKAVDVPVTVKIRLGWDATSKNAPDLARVAQEAGASMVTVHGRTRAQMFRGKADWQGIARVKAAVGIPVVANGDILGPEDARRCLEASGADGVMIGRGALGRPWLLHQVAHYLESGETCPEPDADAIYELAVEHLRLMLSFHGNDRGLRLAKRHLCYYTRGKRGGALFRKALNLAREEREVIELIGAFFREGDRL